MSLTDRCALQERAAQRHPVPIFGLIGSKYEAEHGCESVPGPLVWAQVDTSYTQSLKDGGKARLTLAMENISQLACPGNAVSYMRTAGSHGAGHAGAPGPPASPNVKGRRITFNCSQGALAASRKRGNNGVRRETKAGSGKPDTSTSKTPTADGPAQKKRAVFAHSDCTSAFVLALRNESSRKPKCSICGVFVRFSSSAAEPDPVPTPTGYNESGVCPWAVKHTGEDGCHVVQSGFRVVKASISHKNHWPRAPRLIRRVPEDVAKSMVAMRHKSGASASAIAAMYAEKTDGLLSSRETSAVLRRASAGGGKDTGLPGLLEHFEDRGDVAYVVRWRVVLASLVGSDQTVAGGGDSLNVKYELYCPPTGQGAAASRWDITELFTQQEGITSTSTEWSVAIDMFRNGDTPEGTPGVHKLTSYVVGDMNTLNAGSVFWMTRGQTKDAVRCLSFSATDTTPKTSSTNYEYGAFMGKGSRGGSVHVGHYLCNGLSRANYRFVHAARRFMLGRLAAKTECRLGDGDPWLQVAMKEDGAAGTCAYHAVNIPLLKLGASQGFTKGERQVAADVKDLIHAGFRNCETETELCAHHKAVLAHIRDGTAPPGPTNRRRARAARFHTGDSTMARRISQRTSSRKKWEVARFESRANGTIKVRWVNYDDATDEPFARLLKDLGPRVYSAHCRAAGIPLDDGEGNAPLHGPAAAAEVAGGRDAEPEQEDLADAVDTVQRFERVGDDGMVVVRWVGSRVTTAEPAESLLHDLGKAQFSAFCNAAGITEKSLKYDFESKQDATVTLSSVLKTFYLDEIWPKRFGLAACYRRGCMHMDNYTSGAAENNFKVLKHGGDTQVNDKTSLRNLGERLRQQEARRTTNIATGRATEFSAVVDASRAPSVPANLRATWTRKALNLVSAEARLAGIGAVAKYCVWAVPPQAGSGASAAWVVQRAAPRTDGAAHRVRVVHQMADRMVCTCRTWETYSIECRHVDCIHGSVADTSASPFWRQGSALGFNDDVLLDAGPRPLGPTARTVNVHSAEGQPRDPPEWAVLFKSRHVELVSSVAGAGAVGTESPPAADRTSLPRAAPEGNHAIGKKCAALLNSVVATASSAATEPAVAASILEMAAALHAKVNALASETSTKSEVDRLGTTVSTEMRPSRSGPGSFQRGKGAYG